MVCHIVKVNSNGFLFKEIDALDTNLSVLCLMLLLLLLLLFLLLQLLLIVTTLLGLGLDS